MNRRGEGRYAEEIGWLVFPVILIKDHNGSIVVVEEEEWGFRR